MPTIKRGSILYRIILLFLINIFGIVFIRGQSANVSLYTNPVIRRSLPDPTVIKARNGYYYLYATEEIRNIPIYKSQNLVDWQFVGTVFSNENHPNFLKDGQLWAPDINYINDKYVLYYSLSKWGEHLDCGIGVAVSDDPEGPFIDKGKIFTGREIGVRNSVDEFFYSEKGKNYLFWGSFDGIYGIELSEDGLGVKSGASKMQIAGSFIEATAIEKHKGYYYLFGSKENCCEGANSKYHIIYGRSNNLFGPYVTKDGKSLIDNHYEILLHGNDSVAGPGHQSRLIKDDKGQDWIIYHGYLKTSPQIGRVLFLDRLIWDNYWPYVERNEPSMMSEKPYFRKQKNLGKRN